MTGLMRRLGVVLLGATLLGCEAKVESSTNPVASATLAQASAPAQVAAPVAAPVATPASAASTATAGAPAASVAKAPRPPILVLNSRDASVSVIDADTWQELRRVNVGKEPHHLYLTPDEKSVIVANAASNSLTFLDPRTADVQRTVPDIVDPYHLRFSPDMKWFVTAANRLNHIDIYSWHPTEAAPFKLVKRIHAPKTPSHLWIDSKSTVVYASLQDSDELMAIDLATQTPRWKIQVGKMPADVFVTRDDQRLFVGMTGDKFVEVYDVGGATGSTPPKLVKRIETGQGAHAFRSLGDGKHLLVSNRVANHVSQIDLATLEVSGKPLPGGLGPDCMDVSPDGKTVLLTSRWAGMLSVVDVASRTIVRQVKVGRSPHGVWTLEHAPRN